MQDATRTPGDHAERERLSFRVHGLDCAEEVGALRRTVGPVVGGDERLSFDLLQAKMTVDVEPQRTTADDVIRAAAKAGLRAEPWAAEASAAPDLRTQRDVRAKAVLTIASGALAAAGFVVHAVAAGGPLAALGAAAGDAVAPPVAARVLYALAIAAAWVHVLPRAFGALRRARPDMHLLMTVAVVGAIAIGEWSEAAAVAFLFALSLALESWSMGRARRAVAALLDLTPPTARVLRSDGTRVDVPVGEVEPGKRFLVRPAERVPLDGIVVSGEGGVDQAPLTGESVPVLKTAGDEVFAGSINGEGVLLVEATRRAGETELARIVQLVAEAQTHRAPVQRWVDRFAQVYTPIVLGVAVVLAVAPPLVGLGAWDEWFYRALVLLVIACPCALVLSTPVSIVAALTSAAHHGVLVKGGEFLERAARLDAVAFDKTGTLTQGRPAVIEVVPLSGHSEADVLARAAAMEAHSEHPLAQAIVEHAHARDVPHVPVADLRVAAGKGASGTFEGRRFWIGSHRYLAEQREETAEVRERMIALSRGGRTVVFVGDEKHVCGLIVLADRVRGHAADAVARLRSLGVGHIALLTGDNSDTADAIAREVGVDEVRAELLPEEKVAVVDDLLRRHGRVAMVGDGVNDAPALARATLGIAMGAAGSDAALETADVALLADDLGRIPWLVSHARRTLAIVRQNVAFSLAVKACFMALTLAGFASLWAAIAADMGASLLVLANALRLLRADAVR